MKKKYDECNLRLSADIESKSLPEGTFLLKQTRLATYMALTVPQYRVLSRFAQEQTPTELLNTLLAEGVPLDIHDFHRLVRTAVEGGFLTGADVVSAAPVAARRWLVGWDFWLVILGCLALMSGGVWGFRHTGVVVPATLRDWGVVLLFFIAALSAASLLAGCVLHGFGRAVYAPRIRWRGGLPFFAIDTRDAFMGGRLCQASLSVQELAIPFLTAVVAYSMSSDAGVFAAALLVLHFTSPFGDTAAHNLIHAALRRGYQLPRCRVRILTQSLLRRLFTNCHPDERRYVLAYCLYSLAWLGGVLWLAAELVHGQAGALLQDALFAWRPDMRIAAGLGFLLVMLLTLGTVVFLGWLVLRNLHTLAAPNWFKAENAVVDRCRAADRPADERLHAFLRTCMLFEDIGEEGLRALTNAMHFVKVKPRTLIVREGDQGGLLFLIYSGRVVVSKQDEVGGDAVVALLGPGDAFGEVALLDRVPRTASVRSAEPTELLALTRTDFDGMLLPSLGAERIRNVIQIAAFLRRVNLFSTLTGKAIQALARDFVIVNCRRGELLLRQNQVNDAFHVIYEGQFEIRRDGEVIALLGSGEFFGEVSLVRGQPAIADVVAVKPGRCLKLPKDRFLDFLKADMHTGETIEETMKARLDYKKGADQ